MADYWVSNKKYWCKYCEIFIQDNKPSREHHENGLKHKGNVDRFLRNIHKKEKAEKDEEVKNRALMAQITAKAAEKFGQDVSSGHAKAPSVNLYNTVEDVAVEKKQSVKPLASKDSRRITEDVVEYLHDIPVIGAWQEVVVAKPKVDNVKVQNAVEEAESLAKLNEEEQEKLLMERKKAEEQDPEDLRLYKVTEKRVQVEEEEEGASIGFKKRKTGKKNIRTKE